MNERVVPLFESILDQRKVTKQMFIENEQKELQTRLEELEERSQIVKNLIQEVMAKGPSSSRIEELLLEERSLLTRSIERADRQKEEALKQCLEAEERASELKRSEKPLKEQYKKRISELQEINRQKETTIQEIDQMNSALYEEVKAGAQEIRKLDSQVNKMELLRRKKQTIIEIIKELHTETEESKVEIAQLTETYQKLHNNWTYLNSLLAKPKQLSNEFLVDISDLPEIKIDLKEEIVATKHISKKEKWEREFEKQFIKLEVLKEELNAATRLNEQLRNDKENLEKGMKNNQKTSDKQAHLHGRSNSNPFDYVIKPAFTGAKKETSEEFSLSYIADNQSDIGSIEDESMDASVLDIFS